MKDRSAVTGLKDSTRQEARSQRVIVARAPPLSTCGAPTLSCEQRKQVINPKNANLFSEEINSHTRVTSY